MLDKLTEKKLMIIIPIAVLLLVSLFSLAVAPMIFSNPKEIPIAILNNDQGMISPKGEINAGKTLIETIQKTTNQAEEKPIIWIIVKDEKSLKNGFDNKDYYATLVIPKDYTKLQATLQTERPVSPSIELTINQGLNPTVATLTETMITKMIDNVNNNLRPVVLEKIKDNELTNENAEVYLNPIKLNINYINESGTGLASMYTPMVIYMLTWMASIFTSVLFLLFISKTKTNNRKEYIKKSILKILYGIAVVTLIALLIAFITTSIFDFEIAYLSIFGFVLITLLGLILLMIGVLFFTGIKGIFIFVLTMLLGMSTIMLPYEMLPSFWQNFVYPWVPMRFIGNGVRELLYISGNVINDNSIILLLLGCIGLFLITLGITKNTLKIKKK